MSARDVIAQALALSEAATGGPWRADDEHGLMSGAVPAWCVSRTNETGAFLGDIAYSAQGPQASADAAFTAAARTLLPALAEALGDVLALAARDLDESPDYEERLWDEGFNAALGDAHAAITAALSEVTP